jgi:hypothetical protein
VSMALQLKSSTAPMDGAIAGTQRKIQARSPDTPR